MTRNYSKGSVKPYALHRNSSVTESTPSSLILDSVNYAANRVWFIENLGIDVELVRHDPAFWLGVSIGASIDKMDADNGNVV